MTQTTKAREFLSPTPAVLPARVSIHHPQLRDVLQPGADSGSVLFVSRQSIGMADFTSMKPVKVVAKLDFPAVCLKTGAGIMAAGGAQSELALRPLISLGDTTPLDDEAHGSSSSSSNRHSSQWRLTMSTSGSINNSICIAPASTLEYPLVSSSSHRSSPDSAHVRGRRRSSAAATSHVISAELDEEEQELQDLAAAYGYYQGLDASGTSAAERNDRQDRQPRRREESSALEEGAVLLVSNNDQTLRCFKLRPGTGSTGEQLEAGLPGLSRVQTVPFPTAINHSSLSPDGRTLVAVGDTPDVFLYNLLPTGDFQHIATWKASTDASFNTTWSPDGTKFAVAAQDGVVSVFDVRSSKRVAALRTSGNVESGAGAARAVKWSPRGDLLAFTEHRNFFHVVETNTWTETQRIAVPPNALPVPAASASTTATEAMAATAASTNDTSSTSQGDASSAGTAASASTPPGWTRATGATPASGSSRSTWAIGDGTHGASAGAGAPRRVFLDREAYLEWSLVGDAAAIAGSEQWDEALPVVRGYGAMGPGLWGNGGLRRDELGNREPSVSIAGLTWDAEGEHLFVATDRLIARYDVNELRRSFAAPDQLL